MADAALRLANRTDCAGGYRRHPTTRKQTDADWMPMISGLFAHFSGVAGRVLGLHSTSPDNRCKWIAFDVDAHNGESAADNLAVALTLADRSRDNGLAPYLFDSDGRGGIHVWAMLTSLTPSADAFTLARRIRDDLVLEAFPKQPTIRTGGYGNWIRLPGRHPKRDHWSRIWTGESWGTPDETVEAFLQMSERCPASS